MQINLTITVRRLQADGYDNAKQKAFNALVADPRMRITLRGIGVSSRVSFVAADKVAREADGTFTVTIP
jgi:hypothetical protein